MPDIAAVQAGYLEPPAANLMQQINAEVFDAFDRKMTREMAEAIAPGRVHDGADGSMWILTPDSGPGVELRGWRLH